MQTKIEQIDKMIDEESNRIYAELKGKAETYSELELAINSSLKKAKWMGNEVEVLILEKAMKMYEEDIAVIKTLPLKGAEIKDCCCVNYVFSKSI